MKRISLTLALICLCYSIQAQDFQIKNLSINDDNSQFGLVFYNNNDVYFSAPEPNKENIARKKDKKHQLLSLYKGRKTKNGQIVDVDLFRDAKKTSYNSSTVIISPDGQYLYLTTNSHKKSNTYKKDTKTYNLFIVRAEFIEGKGWSNFKRLSFCKPEYSYGHPALSPDGQTLYFVSNIPSAKGPTDIFKVHILDDNTYSEPENLGLLVNSVRKEMFPYIDSNGILYFSSDRSEGYGGLDIYKAEPSEAGTFKAPELMPSPINSKYDDFSLVYKPQKEEGYFSSKRPSGKGSDDIYYFTIAKDRNAIATSELETKNQKTYTSGTNLND